MTNSSNSSAMAGKRRCSQPSCASTCPTRSSSQALHDQDDAAGLLVVEPTVERAVVPLVGRVALRLRFGLRRLKGIVYNEKVCSTPGNHTAYRSRQTGTVGGRYKLADRLLLRAKPRREQPLVPVARHYTAT